MATEFTDIRLVGLDDEQTTRANPTGPLYDVHFVFSARPLAWWAKFVWSTIGSRGIAGPQGWPRNEYFVVRCAIYEVGRVLAARGRILEATNRQYREWATAQEEALVPTATEVRRGSMNHPRSARANRLSQWSMVRELSDVPRALLTTVRVVPRQHFDRHERE